MPEISDTLTAPLTDTLPMKDSLAGSNFFVETGKKLFEIFLQPSHQLYEGNAIDHWQNIWQFGFLLAMILLIAILRAGFGNRMNQFINAVMVTRQLRQLMREEGFIYHPFSMLLLLNASVIYSLIVYKSLLYFHWYQPEGSGFLFYGLILILTLIILFLKIMVLRLVEFLTDTDLGQRENRYTWILFHQMAGIILLPVSAILLFGKSIFTLPGIIFALSLLIIFLIFRVGKGFLIASGNKVFFLHIFLYLCALEIIPLIVLLKVLVTQINGFNE